MNIKKPMAVVCDFDGTITKSDVWNALWDFYTGTSWRQYNLAYGRGEINYPQLVEHCVQVVNFSEQQALDFVDQQCFFRDGFWLFLKFCLTHDIRFQVASGGLDFYINHMLKDWLDRIEIYCNPARFIKPVGMEIDLPWFDSDYCPSCGNCKRRNIEDLSGLGYFTVAIGDGTTDRCMAKSADLVFARDELAEYCVQNRIDYCGFESFDDILAHDCFRT